ncbi:MAG: polyprenyl synthetase family protein [Candidatus Thorarchaeota archaeon]|nr:polyprenyl synthetase family protein [Candidatus Thorarchaeota archaeon]
MTEFKALMKKEIAEVNKALEEYLQLLMERARALSPVHELYYGNLREYLIRGGKRLRPILVVSAFKAIREEVDLKYLYRASCSVEMLHNGSLLHDDLIDHDEIRRGGPTFHALYREWFKKHAVDDETKAADFGMAMAVLGGDSLLNFGGMIISASELPPNLGYPCLSLYQQAYQELADGVLLEMNMVNDESVTAELYLEMTRLKTAVLMEKSLLIGATLARGTDSQKDALSKFGIRVGQAFQAQDDILGSFGDEAVTGKSTEGDIREGKKTLLVIEAYRLADASQRKTLDSLLGKTDITEEEVNQVRDIFRETGALDSTHKMMEELLAEGQDALQTTEPALNSTYRDFLLDLSNFLVHRSY